MKNILSAFRDKKIYHVSHIDLDGVSCRVLSEYCINPLAKDFVVLNTSNYDIDTFDYSIAYEMDIVLFTDITPTKRMYDIIKSQGKEVYIFDHHETGREELGVLPHYYYTLDKSATRIFYEILKQDTAFKDNTVIRDFVELVDTYDLFKKDSKIWRRAKGLNSVFYGLIDWYKYDYVSETTSCDLFTYNMLFKFKKFKKFEFTSKEIDLINSANKKIQHNYEKAKTNIVYRKDREGNIFVYFELPSKISIVANKILNEDPSIDYAIAYSTFRRKNKNISLRCRNDFDVRRIAEKWGLVGQQQASGIIMDEEDLKQLRSGNLTLV